MHTQRPSAGSPKLACRGLAAALLLSVLASACAASSAASPTATPLQTETLAPTATPEPTPTSMPPTEPPSPRRDLDDAAFMTLLSLGDYMYQNGGFGSAIIVYSEMLAYQLVSDQEAYVLALRGETYERLGEFEAAIADYVHAVTLGFEQPGVLNQLCWDCAITGQAELGLPFCERAVQGDASTAARDSRGVVYAQLGMVEEALADFEAVVTGLESAEDPELRAIRDRRQGWIDALRSGVNPITAEVLVELQEETGVARPEPRPTGTAAALTRAHALEGAEQQGFVFETVTELGGQESVTGERRQGGCNATLVLSGPAVAMENATLQLVGCDDETQSGHILWFMGLLLQEDPEDVRTMLEGAEIVRAMVWLITDVYDVIEGQEEGTAPKEIGDLTVTARRSSEPQPGIEVNAAIGSGDG